MDVAAGIAGDEFVIGNECAAMNFGVARKCHDQCPGLHIPDLQGFVPGGREGEPPVRTQRTLINLMRVALESAEFVTRLHLPNLERAVLRGRKGELQKSPSDGLRGNR